MGSPVVHFEVIGKDAEALQSFYADLFDWNVNVMEGMNYGIVESSEPGIAGGIGAPPPGSDVDPHGVTFYVQVGDLQATLDKAESLGGKTVNPPMDVPGGPTLAHLTDPEGHLIGLVEG